MYNKILCSDLKHKLFCVPYFYIIGTLIDLCSDLKHKLNCVSNIQFFGTPNSFRLINETRSFISLNN